MIWQNIETAPEDEMAIVQLWNGKVDVGSRWEGGFVDHWLDPIDPRPTMWRLLPTDGPDDISEADLLRADLKKYGEHEVMAGCEGCGAALYTDDDYVGDDCHGCAHVMLEGPVNGDAPCYAYRVGKPSAAEPVQS